MANSSNPAFDPRTVNPVENLPRSSVSYTHLDVYKRQIMVFTADPEEQRKRLLTVLMSGDQVIVLDNIEGVLSGDALCTALTTDTISDRLLGTQRQGTAPTCVTWLATGNNLTVGGDMTRRVVYCTLDPQCERPEEREFSRNLPEWIPAHRPALVVAGLTALRAYIVAGKPPQPVPNLGSFEEWSNLCLLYTSRCV